MNRTTWGIMAGCVAIVWWGGCLLLLVGLIVFVHYIWGLL